MAYTDVDNVQDVQPATVNIADKVLVRSAARQGGYITGRLAEVYDLPVSVAAAWSLAFGANPADADTLELGGKTYTYKDTPASVNDIQRGANQAASIKNTVAALNETDSSAYFTGTTINKEFRGKHSAAVITVTARKSGTDGNNLTIDDSGSSAITAASTVTGLGDYSVLEQINIWLVTGTVLSGQARSNKSTQNANLIKETKEDGYKWLENLISGATRLVDIDGSVLAYSDDALPVSSTEDGYPFADESDPVNWGHDEDKDFDDDRDNTDD